MNWTLLDAVVPQLPYVLRFVVLSVAADRPTDPSGPPVVRSTGFTHATSRGRYRNWVSVYGPVLSHEFPAVLPVVKRIVLRDEVSDAAIPAPVPEHVCVVAAIPTKVNVVSASFPIMPYCWRRPSAPPYTWSRRGQSHVGVPVPPDRSAWPVVPTEFVV
jgi:hypothetical protein